MFQSALNLSVDLQSVHDNLPEHAKMAIGGIASGAKSIREGVNSKLGERYEFKTSAGKRELVDLGPIGASANISKARCSGTGTEFVLKRLEMCTLSGSNEKGNAGLVSLEAIEALAQRADLVPSLPESPNLVRCFGCRADNTTKTPAKLLLLELCTESVADVLVQRGSLKAEEALHVLRDVADGLLCLHSMAGGPVVHGSVEPAHILRDAESGLWKLGSFGAAHKSLENDPEDAASDIWQLGILLLTVLFGQSAFDKKIGHMDANSVHNSMVASIASGRPANAIEGRICLLACWLLAADPAKRPTAEQVVIAVASLASMPAPQLSLAFPADVRKDFKTLSMALVRRTIFEAVNAIEGADRRILINKYGEEALLNPSKLPAKVKEGALSKEQTQYIRVIQSFLGAADISVNPEAKKLSEELAKARKQQTTSAPATETCSGQGPTDLLDMDEDLLEVAEVPQLIEVAPTPGSAQPAELDLFGTSESAPVQPASTGDLLFEMDAPAPVPAAPAELDLFGNVTPSAAALPVPAAPLDDLLFGASAAPAPASTPTGDLLFGEPAGAPTAGYPATPAAAPVKPASLDLASLYAAAPPPAMPSMPIMQAPAAQDVPSAPVPKKEEPKDPFAGIAGF